jgi:RNA-splicing ligase RtcB
MDREVLMHQMRERFEEEFAKALRALEDAPDGHWIEASEMAFRDAALIVAREGLELAVQAKVDADPTAQAAAFSPSGYSVQRPSAGAQ